MLKGAYSGYYVKILTLVVCFMMIGGHCASAASSSVIKALKQADSKNYGQSRQTMTNVRDRTERDTYTWFVLANNKSGADYATATKFISEHRNWPGIDKIKANMEKSIPSGVSNSQLVSWFSKNPPVSGKGMMRYLDAMISIGRVQALKPVLQKWWETADISREDQRAIYGRYKLYFTQANHVKRMNYLFGKGSRSNGLAMGEAIGGKYASLARARNSLQSGSGNPNGAIGAVPASLQNDEGLLFDRMKWRRKKGHTQGAIEILNNAPRASQMQNPSAWWKERHIVVRRLMENKQYKTAYRVASSHKQTEGFPKSQAEWISGFLALRFVNQPSKAFTHFEKLYNSSKSPISKGRGGYWAARSASALGQKQVADKWYRAAAKYPEVYYGQMSLEALGRRASKFNLNVPLVSAEQKSRFNQNSVAKAARILSAAGQKKSTELFLLHLGDTAKSASDYIQAAELAEQLNQRHIAIKLAQKGERDKSVVLHRYTYPVLVNELRGVKDVEWALTNAIIRQESRFNQAAQSHAGARGLMQLMPATARETASRSGRSHQTAWLTTRPSHNIFLGTRYLKQMIKRYRGNYAMAAAAYNAGPGRVDRWIKEMGDPRTSQISLTDWVELIPIYETRNYVQRVLEGTYVYRVRLQGTQVASNHEIHARMN